jgi:RNA polymerase sigma-70 factor (ECF subfamily)
LFSWLYRICVNLCYERMDRRWRQVAYLQEDLEALAGPLAADRQAQAEDRARREKMLQLIEAQKGLLGEPCRGLVEMRDERGESYAAISKALRVPMGTVMSRLARCRETLKKLVLKAMEGGKDV